VKPVAALVLRDMRLAVRVGGGAFIGVLFFLIVVTLVPFAVGPDLALLARIGPAILWLGALLANLLGLDRLLATDHEDGSLDLILMTRIPTEIAVAAKALAHWLTTGLPLVIAAPFLGILLNLDPKATGAVALTLLAGTPAEPIDPALAAADHLRAHHVAIERIGPLPVRDMDHAVVEFQLGHEILGVRPLTYTVPLYCNLEVRGLTPLRSATSMTPLHHHRPLCFSRNSAIAGVPS
jgi:heme exporter protein CcmB